MTSSERHEVEYEYTKLEYGECYPVSSTKFNPVNRNIEYLADLAEVAAEHSFHEDDRGELCWPLKLEIFVNGKSCGKYSVDLTSVPSFSSYEIKED